MIEVSAIQQTEVGQSSDSGPLRRLRAARTSKRMTLRQTATAAGIDPAHLSRVERGEKGLSLESLHRLAVVLELREIELLLRPFLPRKQQQDG
ncbi:helix-turn-helix domain-containing protein [Nonomuraea sp. NPDC002799]